MESHYQPIENYGVIGNLRTAALVGMDGSIDWLCLPHFDSPSVFAALLDDRKGGRFRIAPAGDHFRRKQFYWPDTAILVTRFLHDDGVGEVEDYMPVGGTGTSAGRADPESPGRPRPVALSSGVPSGLRLRPRCSRMPRRRARRPLRRAGAEPRPGRSRTAAARRRGCGRRLHARGRGERHVRLAPPRLARMSPAAAPESARRRSCSATPSPTGGAGSRSAPTPAAGGRWSTARP